MDYIAAAAEHFAALIKEQLKRVEEMAHGGIMPDFAALDTIVIGVAGGDGIGPAITAQAKRVLERLLSEQLLAGKVVLKDIAGLTIENRVKAGKAIPDDVLEELKSCHVILKGPTATPREGDGLPNVESANVAMRKALDLFANVRPVRVPAQGIDWTFFRENTEGSYVVGSRGINVTPELAIDFAVTTTTGTERIARAAFEFAKNNGKTRVTAVTKANVIKTTDGKFLSICREMAKEYKDIEFDDWYIDITAAKLLDEKRRRQFQVFVLPNLYGDILTDEAAELQGGVGTAGSANIGTRYAMFEAIHGSAPRMVSEGRAQYADPSSVMRAAALLLAHIGFAEKALALDRALDICTGPERRFSITGREGGATCQDFADYVMEVVVSGG